MSEVKAIYKVSNDLVIFSNKACVKRQSEAGYLPPKPDEVKTLIDLSGINRKKWALLLGVSYNDKKGSSTIRRWTMNEEANDYRQISYSVWRLMLIYAGLVDSNEDAIRI